LIDSRIYEVYKIKYNKIMKNLIIIPALILSFIALPAFAEITSPLAGKIVALDAGHGGTDGGGATESCSTGASQSQD
jgi:N-acetylmuramoyl-L-alanine amidase